MTNTGAPFSTETLIALAALKGKLHDPNSPVRYWGLDYSTGAVREYAPGSTSRLVDVPDMPVWDRKRLVKSMNQAFKAGQVAA